MKPDRYKGILASPSAVRVRCLWWQLSHSCFPSVHAFQAWRQKLHFFRSKLICELERFCFPFLKHINYFFLWNLPFPSLLQFIMLFYYFKTRSPFQVLLSNKKFWSCAKNLKSGFGKSNHFLCLSDSKWATITL